MLKLKEKPIKKPTDKILIQGLVTVWQGEGKDKKILIKKAENHWVDGGLRGLLSFFIGDNIHYTTQAWAYTSKVYLGMDTVTVTTHGMTVLTSPIGTAPGTPPNVTSGADRGNPATGEWNASCLAVWYGGTISGTVGEMALYLRPFTSLTLGWSTQNTLFGEAMVSRLSNADGDFSSFAIDESKSLTVQWEIRITFA